MSYDSNNDWLTRFLTLDPWEQHSNDDDSWQECHYCESKETRGSGLSFVGLHFDDCMWVLARLDHMDSLPPGNDIYAPPPPDVCKECGLIYTWDHHANIHSEGDHNAHWAHICFSPLYSTRPIRDSLPAFFAVPRGKITFISVGPDGAKPLFNGVGPRVIDLTHLKEPE